MRVSIVLIGFASTFVLAEVYSIVRVCNGSLVAMTSSTSQSESRPPLSVTAVGISSNTSSGTDQITTAMARGRGNERSKLERPERWKGQEILNDHLCSQVVAVSNVERGVASATQFSGLISTFDHSTIINSDTFPSIVMVVTLRALSFP